MNILYITHGFPPSIGAGSINAYEIAKYLISFGHKILVLVPGVFSKISRDFNPIETSDSNIEVFYSSKIMKIPLNLVFSHFENMARFIIRLKPKFNPDIILSQYSAYHFASVVGGYLSKILRKPHIIRSHDIFFPTDLHSFPFKVFHSAIYSRIYRSILNSDIFYVTTTEMKRYYLKFKKLREVNFQIHHNGIDTKMFYPYNNQETLKDKFGAESIMLFIGQISKEYDLRYILNALPTIIKEHKDTHFIIIGAGHHSDVKDLNDFTKKNDLTKNIHFLGIKPHKEIPFFVNNCDFGIGRITHESLWRYMIPVKCLEYMACKKPFLSGPISQDIIKNNDVGLIINRNFINKEIIDKLNIFLEDKTFREKLGVNGFNKIQQNFNWEQIMKDFNKDLLKL